jgi:hypothetical protein
LDWLVRSKGTDWAMAVPQRSKAAAKDKKEYERMQDKLIV